MEKVLQYFLQELHNANDNLIKLSVITALHSFLIKESKCAIEEISTVSDLMESLCDILKDGLNLDESDFHDSENQSVEMSTELESCTSKTNPNLSGSKPKDSCQTDRKRSMDKLCSKRKSELSSDTTVENLNRLMILKIIYELSKKCNFFNVISLSVQKLTLFTLAAFLSYEKSESCDKLFRFSHNFTKCVQKFLNSKDGKVTVQIMSEKSISHSLGNLSLKQQLQIYEPNFVEYFEHIFSQNNQLLSLRILPDSPEDINLLDVLIPQQVAWGRNIECNKDVNPEKENKGQKKKMNESKDQDDSTMSCKAAVTKVLNGNLFWVNIRDGIHSVERIHSILKESLPSLQYCKCKENDIVAVIIGEEPSTHIVRGKVLCVKSKVVTVFALDIGGVYDVPHLSVFGLPLELLVIPQQAVMANLYDISPTPVDSTFVEMAAASLTNLSRSPTIAHVMRKMKILKALPILLCCGNPVVANQAARLATNLARSDGYLRSEGWWNIMLASLELLNKHVKKFLATKESMSTRGASFSTSNATSSLRKLTTPKAKNIGSEGGPESGSDKNLIITVLRLLSNVMHNNRSLKDVFYQQHGLEMVLICQQMMGKEKFLQRSVIQLLSFFVHDSFSCSRPSVPVSPLGRSNSKTVMAEVFNEDTDEESDEREGGSYHDDEWGEIDDTTSEGKGGSIFPLASDPRYEMLQGLNLGFHSISALVCGMLNSGQGGAIYVGITKDGEVKGEKISLDMRDNLRLGIDKLMSQLVPPIVHLQVQVRFVPVVEWAEIQDVVKDTEYFAIEILCSPMPGIVHTVKRGECYYRTGRKTLNVNEQGIRHLIVLDEEEKHREEILVLQRKLDMLTSSLKSH